MPSELERFCESAGVRCSAQYGAVEVPEGWTPGTHPYRCTLRYKRRTLTVPFYCGPANTSEPSAADVLSCIILDASCGDQSFEDYCADLGENPDSRKAEQTWRACAAMVPRLRRFLGDEFDEFTNKEH